MRSDIKPLPSLERLRQLFAYDSDNGELRWKSIPKNFRRAKVGDLVGTINRTGYLVVGIDRRYYYVHRIIWKLVTGDDPIDQIDHRDGNRLNNRLANFRPVSNRANIWNSKLRVDNQSGYKGVHYKRGRWRAVLTGRGHLGCFTTKEQAAQVWREAAEKQRGEFFRAE